MDAFNACCGLLPKKYRDRMNQYKTAEEIRLRCGKPASVLIGGKEICLSDSAVSENEILQIIELATGASVHSSASSLSMGYIEYKGVRIGVCGQAIYSEGKILGFKKYNSLSIRIPHEARGIIPPNICDEILLNPENLLIVAPPGIGKTTALRELVRIISEKGIRVSLIDERGELAGEGNSFELGRCTDILSGLPKSVASMLVLRGMNPQVIAMDEISSPEDVDAIFEIAGCGVCVFSTSHGNGFEDMLHRPSYKRLFENNIFSRLLTINIKNGRREYKLERLNL